MLPQELHWGSGRDRLQLAGIAGDHQLRTGFLGDAGDLGHLAQTDHPALVEDDDAVPAYMAIA